MNRLTGWIGVAVLVCSSGCTMCDSCDMGYAAVGGVWQRHDPINGRVGSIFDPAGGPAMEGVSVIVEAPDEAPRPEEAPSPERALDEVRPAEPRELDGVAPPDFDIAPPNIDGFAPDEPGSPPSPEDVY